MAAVRNLGFLNFQILVTGWVENLGVENMHCRSKFHQNRPNGCTDIAFKVFQNGGRPPFWIFKLIF